MDLFTYLQSYFTVGVFAKLIDRKRHVNSIVFNEVFSHRTNTPSPRVKIGDVVKKIKNVPVVARGAQALAIGGSTVGITEIEPMPIRLSDYITGAQLNDLKGLYGDGSEDNLANVNTYVDKMILDLMTTTDLTRNALCAQAIRGKIDYMMSTEAGYERYQVSYGDGETLTFTPSVSWDSSAKGFGDIISDLEDMQEKLIAAGFSGEVKYLLGKDAFKALSNKISRMTNENRVDAKVEKGKIILGGFELVKDSITYTDRDASGNEIVKYEVDPGSVLAYVADIPELTYCAIDDLDGNLQALPFFSKTFKTNDPSGIKVLSESKPMPLVSAKGFCWSTVVGGANETLPADDNPADDQVYTEAQLLALTKDRILAIATARGYELAVIGANTKAEIIADFLAKQTAVLGE